MDAELAVALKQYKQALLDNLQRITPAMLTLVTLEQAAIDAIVATVEGGAANVQDIYPLAPLQEGMLFHHLLESQGDTYLLSNLLAFRSKALLEDFLAAMQQVIDRHDVLRTGIVWEGLAQPLQVVRRQACLPVEWLDLDPTQGEIATQLQARYDPRHYRLDIGQAPLLRCHATQDGGQDRWLLQVLSHHLAIDHTSLELLIEEAQAIRQGRLAELPAPAPFRNFVAQARLGVSEQEHETFFKSMLADIDAPTAPFDLLDAAGGMKEARRRLSPELAQAIRLQARRLGVSAASLMHLAWGLVLARLSGRSAVVFGTVLFGRMQGGAASDRVLGMLMNTLPLRLDIDGQGVEAALRQTHACLVQLLRHEHAPLALAQRCSGVAAPAPLFTSLLNYRYSSQPGEGQLLGDIELLGGQERSNYPVSLDVDDFGSEQGFMLTAQVPASVDPRLVCDYVGEALTQLVQALARQPQLPLAQLDVLPAEAHGRLLHEWNATEVEYQGGAAVHRLFEAQAAARPDAMALREGELVLSYAELNARANRLAHHLRALGLQPDGRVALYARRSAATVVAMLATLKAGGAYVPLDPDYPLARLQYMLRDSGALLLLKQGTVPLEITRELADGARVLDLQDDAGDWQGRSERDGEAEADEGSRLAYVFYTSGSTGQPKGVMVEHRSVRNQILMLAERIELGPADRVLQFASLSFDGSVEEIFASLAQGACVVLRSDAWLTDAETFWRLCADHGISVVDLPTQFWTQLAMAGLPAPACVRQVIIGGEAVGDSALQAWFAGTGRRPRLLNTYGPTEATVSASSHEPSGQAGDWRNIGRPGANTRIHILDSRLRPVPLGVAGELYIGGVQLARGYLNLPELTAERFIDDPFLPGSRLYKSGDLGRRLADGSIEYLGRNDFQIKLRGFRIELGEVEAKLASLLPDVVVIAREDQPGEMRLLAYYTGEQPAADLRQQAAVLLPAYMVPAAFVRLAAWPLSPNGKLDRKALPAPEADAYGSRSQAVPQGEVEMALAAIWTDLLKIEQVGRHDNFFALGGHSLLAVQLLSRLRQTLQVDLPLGELFEYPQLAQLAVRIGGAAGASQSDIPLVSREAPLPLSPAQQRLWFLSRIEGAAAAYHISAAVWLTGELDRDGLQRALQAIVDRHEALRTCYRLVDGQPRQCLLEKAELVPQVHDLRGHDDPDSAARQLGAEHSAAPFALDRDLPIRVLLLQMQTGQYVLQLVMHHIAADAWAIDVLLDELSRLYGAFLRGEADPLPPLAIQYADYAAWHRNWLADDQDQAAFWRANLAGAPTLLELPTDRPRPAQQDHAGAAMEVRLDAQLSKDLKALSQRHGATLYMTLLASWAALLARLGNQDEVVVGSPVAGRNRAEIEPLIGFFVNTLALRIDLRDEPTVADLLKRTKAQVLAAQAHQDLPFDQVVEALKPPRSLSHTPLFQTMLDWQGAPAAGLSLPGLTVSPLEVAHTTAQFDLTLSLHDGADGLAGVLNYATALFEPATVQRYLGYWIHLLQAMVAGEDQAVASLQILGEAERTQLLQWWNDTSTELTPPTACVHQSFEQQAAMRPEAIALVWGEQQLSYGELNHRANQLAHHLRSLGVGPEVRVALCLERGMEMVVAILAVLKAGGAYVPLDPAYASERLRATLADSQPALVLLDQAGRAALGELDGHLVLDLQADAARWSGLSGDNPAGGAGPQQLAYVIYTSGSTGQPKGVMVEHGQLARLFSATRAWFRFDDQDVWTLFHSFGFDFSVWELWGALSHGGRLVVVPLETARSPADFYALLCEQGVTVLNQTPSAFQQLIAAQTEQPHRLRQIVFGGEALETRLLKPWYERAGNRATQLVNMYGITETTVHVSYCPLLASDTGRVGPSPIGVRIPDLRLYVLDSRRQPVPVGVTGELYVGGAGVARGYLNQPELTAQRFLADPFKLGERIYKTGDLGRWQADGTVAYLGRNDFQVKIRGFRIELGEIEAKLAALLPEVVVIAREDQPGDKRLVAYYSGEAVAAETLRRHAAEHLPAYMVPAAYVRLDRLPLTPNGKLDRKALPAPEGDAYGAREYAAPQGDTEQLLAAIWAELLKVEQVGRHDNFFELGGHSLLAVSLIERLRQAGLHADVRALFSSPTLAELAGQLRSDSQEVVVPPNLIPAGAERITPDMLTLLQLDQAAIDAAVATVEGGAANVQDIYPLAPLQEGILFHHLMQAEGDPYLLISLLGFDSRERLETFLAALRQVIARHDILRTGIAWEGLDQPVQVVRRQVSLPLQWLALDSAQGDIAEQLQSRFDPRHYRLDVSQAPLLRCHAAADPAQGRWLLCVLSHHLADDNTTLKLLLAEAQAIMAGQPLPAPAPFRNLVAQARLGTGRPAHEAFFQAMLADIDSPTAPFGLLDVQGGSAMAEVQQRLAPELSLAIRRQARRLGVSAASLMHLAWALVLARTSGRKEVVFGTVLLGRMQGGAQADRVLGLFINTLPLRIDVDEEGVAAALRRTHALLAQLLRHEHASLALAQRCSGVPARMPLFTSLLNYRHSEEMSEQPAAGLAPGISLLGGYERSNYPLTLSVDDLGEDFALTVQAAAEVGPQRVCALMRTALAELLQALQQAPDRPLRALDVLPAAERALLLEGWNDTAVAYPRERCVQQLFEAQVARTPEATALEQDERCLNYRELNTRANRLAWYLRRLGVGPDSRVAICAHHGVERVVAMLATLKAGGAYVPLDPAYPPERLDFMLRDSAPLVVLSEARLSPEVKAQLCIAMAAYGSAGSVLDLTDDAQRWRQEDTGNPPLAALTSAHLAYVIYTSGSTGRPKGVMVEHASLVNLLYWHIDTFGLHAGSRSAATAGVGFDASGWETWPALCSGGSLLLPPAETDGDPQLLLRWWHAQTLDVSFLVTPLAELAYAAGHAAAGPHTLLTGGDRLRRRPAGLAPGQTLVNNYGPTEATVVATSGVLRRDDRVLHIGRPIANTRVYILDAQTRPAPIGVAGELYIGGAQLARGYLNQAELTAARFIADPFVSGGRPSGGRLYRTGDLARWLADGNIEYLGRADAQLKIRGYRIEPGEVEACLAQVEGVVEVAVLASQEDGGEARLLAYYSATTELTEALRQYAAQYLPAYMVPAAFIQLPSLPLTPNGKLDRQALPQPGRLGVADYQAPQGRCEQALALVWAELLQLEKIGRHDNFFELGGHSLLAMQLLSRLRQQWQVELPLSDLFDHPQLDRLAARLDGMAVVAQQAIPLVGRTGPLPLSLAQQRLWFLSRMEGAGEAYHISGAVRLRGDLDRQVLGRALQAIVARHEALRTCFQLVDGQPRQVLRDDAQLVLRQHDLRGQDEQAWLALSASHSAEPFDLAHALPLRALLLRLREHEYVLQIVMHHICSDGWSVGVLLDELSRLYAAFLHGRPDPLPPLALQYADYAAWQRGWLAEGQDQAAFWRANLAGAPTLLELPTDRPRPVQQDHAGTSVALQLDAQLSRDLKALGQRHGVTLYMTLLASWGALLGRLASQDEVVMGSPVAGRNRAEIEPLIGFFVNTLALRIDLRGEPSVAELLKRTKAQVLAAQAHQDLPFDQVVETLKPPRSLAHTPLFQVMLDWHNTPAAELTMPGLHLDEIDTPLATAQFDLMLSLYEGEDGIAGGLNYATALFDRETAQGLLDYWRRLLQAMVADEEGIVSRLPLLDAAQREQVLRGWNGTARDYPHDACVHQLFEQQVDATPAAIAVDDGEHRLSYAELNRQANRLAHRLCRLGVGPDARVALCTERGAPMLVALLAILKAGGAYVPLDPAYPAERIAYMLADSAPLAVLCAASTRALVAPHVAAGVPVLDLDGGDWCGQPDHNPRVEGLSARHLAYVIYTSGSTGRPKGVMIEHRGLVNYTLDAIGWFGLAAGETVLQQNSLNFDLSIEEIMPALLAGATLLPSNVPFGLAETALAPGMVHLTAAHWHSLVGEWSQAGVTPAALAGVRMVNVTGDALSAHKLKQWEALKPAGTGLVNTYGPTEITVSCSAAYVRYQAGVSRISIGKPFANTRMYILDAQREPVPLGVAGELYISGAGVARGYLNLPELTAERFLDDPFTPGQRMYKTGDLARWLPCGEVEFIGRNDFQVKVRGFRIELGEVEAKLAQLAGVQEVAVIAREDEPGDKRLVAYVVGAEVDVETLRRHAVQTLPHYMVPAAFVALEALPLTPNGKLDRQALPAPDGLALGGRVHAEPEGEVEQALAAIWAELLKLERVGRHDNFFELGGHSLLAVSLIERMRREGLHADVGLLFMAPTLADMAAATTQLMEIVL
ncbi:amino acid adenylation domain-containing protein [Chitinimonas arctica]|uniref:Amino acid adenylation domain-containing protein n=1 Tax=Chitinimonas arctica TaxID=2594795 RepID=A0A516SM01_9NEIS|nr:amino acid adenylation domain-containing protein [Chitinimonas arctica]